MYRLINVFSIQTFKYEKILFKIKFKLKFKFKNCKY